MYRPRIGVHSSPLVDLAHAKMSPFVVAGYHLHGIGIDTRSNLKASTVSAGTPIGAADEIPVGGSDGCIVVDGTVVFDAAVISDDIPVAVPALAFGTAAVGHHHEVQIGTITHCMKAPSILDGSLDLLRCDSFDSDGAGTPFSLSLDGLGLASSASCSTAGSWSASCSDSEDSSQKGPKSLRAQRPRKPMTLAQKKILRDFKDSKGIFIDGERYQGCYVPTKPELQKLEHLTKLTSKQVCSTPPLGSVHPVAATLCTCRACCSKLARKTSSNRCRSASTSRMIGSVRLGRWTITRY
jgi:hypothetical protein